MTMTIFLQIGNHFIAHSGIYKISCAGDTDWGAGLGLRYYTPIGPVRLDVATPLNPNDDDPPVQFYISIGQSF